MSELLHCNGCDLAGHQHQQQQQQQLHVPRVLVEVDVKVQPGQVGDQEVRWTLMQAFNDVAMLHAGWYQTILT